MIQLVKLNNPLMGTETIVVLLSLNSLTLLIVKLNNPLMGTETLFTIFSKPYTYIIQLN